MFNQHITNIIYNYSYLQIYLVVIAYFYFLYFSLAPAFLYVCKQLEKQDLLQKIIKQSIPKTQLLFEIKHSIQSIFIFGLSALPLIYLIRQGTILLLPNSFINIMVGIIILTIWNEIHFFIVHRVMHLPFFMKHVHKIHHHSKVPTVFAVYSFHWFEALLLSTVPLTIAIFIPLSAVAIFLYPMVSILLNFAGHCNYRFGNGKGPSWRLFGSKHNAHHFKFANHYGFASGIMDKLHKLVIPKINHRKK